MLLEGGTMNRKIQRTVGLVMLLVGAIAFGLAAQPGRGGGQARKHEPPRLDIPGAAVALGVGEETLIEAIGQPGRSTRECSVVRRERTCQGEANMHRCLNLARELGLSCAEIHSRRE